MRPATLVLMGTLAAVALAAQGAAQPTRGGDPSRRFVAAAIGLAGASFLGEDAEASRPLMAGVSAGIRVWGPFTAEIDVTHGPGFFGDRGSLGTNHVTTVTGNLLILPARAIGWRWFRLQPYGVVGAGTLIAKIGAFGLLGAERCARGVVSVGGGAIRWFAPRIGVRVEYRYFAGVGDAGSEWGTIDRWTFSRVAAGVLLAW